MHRQRHAAKALQALVDAAIRLPRPPASTMPVICSLSIVGIVVSAPRSRR